jgi:hypothetical protein
MSEQAKHTPGPWVQWRNHLYVFQGPAKENTNQKLIGAGHKIADCSDAFNDGDVGIDEAYANARLIAAAPAMEIALKLLSLGLARFAPDTSEFCFGGLRYGLPVEGFSWNEIVNLIGWDEARKAIKEKCNHEQV